jgi:Xaa-Pro aminopeptidase
MAQIAVIPEPIIALPTTRPFVPASRFLERRTAAVDAMTRAGLDALVIYGDREHGGDLHYLTGVDPRFEEGIYVLPRSGQSTILLGNENLGYAPHEDLGIRVVLYQELSPQGQFRDRPVQLDSLLREAGVERGGKIGIVGAKYLRSGFITDPAKAFGVPSYIVDTVRSIVGEDAVINAQTLFVDPENGIRSINTAHEIAESEYASSFNSASVNAVTKAFAIGARADELSANLFDGGVAHSVHFMVNFGLKTARGLSSPSDQRVALGDAFQVAQGLRGSLTCRSGMVANSIDDLDNEVGPFFDAVTRNYFDVMLAWYRAVRIGATGGDVFAAADAVRDDSLFDFSLNPGHTLGFEEWLHSPFESGNASTLRSGLLLQGDIIPAPKGAHIGVNVEDGLALADEALQKQIADLYPEAWERIGQRREYVRNVIGLELDPSILLLSNTPLWHAPYALDRSRALTA